MIKSIAVLLFTFQISVSMSQKNEYRIKVGLNSTKEDTYKVLSDFASYEKWNSVLVMKNNDSLKIGKKFKVTIINEKGKKSKFKAKTLTNEVNKSFSARQTVLGKWFFSATHNFIIEVDSNGQATFTQKWRFTGILYKPFKKAIFKQLERFKTMNNELVEYLNTQK